MMLLFRLKWTLSFVFLVLASWTLPSIIQAKTTIVTIGTGGVAGAYYTIGSAVANIINKKSKEYGIRAVVESTGGSAFNVNALMSGDLEFGVVQSDRQYQAVKGLAVWEYKGPQRDLRAMFSMQSRTVALVASVDAGINSVIDLKGKRVNIGSPGSGQRQKAIDALMSFGINYQKDLIAEGVRVFEASRFLQDGRIDAFFYTVAHPSGAIKEATSGQRKVRFIAITGVDKLFSKFPYYTKSVIPIKFYPNAENNSDVATFGVKATFVTSAKVPDDVVYNITKEVFGNLELFKKLNPTFQMLTRESMLQGLSAPLHPGAEKYYKECGFTLPPCPPYCPE